MAWPSSSHVDSWCSRRGLLNLTRTEPNLREPGASIDIQREALGEWNSKNKNENMAVNIKRLTSSDT